jgi:hypothetical protein
VLLLVSRTHLHLTLRVAGSLNQVLTFPLMLLSNTGMCGWVSAESGRP